MERTWHLYPPTVLPFSSVTEFPVSSWVCVFPLLESEQCYRWAFWEPFDNHSHMSARPPVTFHFQVFLLLPGYRCHRRRCSWDCTDARLRMLESCAAGAEFLCLWESHYPEEAGFWIYIHGVATHCTLSPTVNQRRFCSTSKRGHFWCEEQTCREWSEREP